jgi:hypothetical protein
MQGLQYIVDKASAIEIARPKTVAQMVTRSGRIRTAERTSLIPYQITVTPPTYSRYEDVRDIIEGLTMTDRNRAVQIQLGQATGTQYITEYSGELNSTQVAALRVATTGTTATIFGNAAFDTTAVFGRSTSTNFDYMDVGGIPNIGDVITTGTVVTSSTVIFAAGDYIQLSGLTSGGTQLGTARTVSLPVVRGTGSTVRVPVARPWIDIALRPDTRGAAFRTGTSTSISVLIGNLPAFKLLPGRIVEWTGDFELVEYFE